MIGAWLSTTWAAPTGRVDAIAGVRSAPEAGLEQPSEWEPEVEPLLVTALLGDVGLHHRDLWGSLAWAGWLVLPEGEADQVSVSPRVGVGATLGAARLEVAGRYDLQWFPLTPTATSGRAEGVGQLRWERGAWSPELSVQGIDRRYPNAPAWSFSSAEGDAALAYDPRGPWRARLILGLQGNAAGESEGAQIRATGELGWSHPRHELWLRYAFYDAFPGEGDDADDGVARSQFTPLGDYSADADALSGAGWTQHRLEAGGSLVRGDWTLRASALARLRTPLGPGSSEYARTIHGQLGLDRELRDGLSWQLTTGVSAVALDSGQSYVDVYGWSGLSWRF